MQTDTAWQHISEPVATVLSNMASAYAGMDSVFSKLHRELRIPPNYALAPLMCRPQQEPKPITNAQREASIKRLRQEGVIKGRSDTDAILTAMCERLNKIWKD